MPRRRKPLDWSRTVTVCAACKTAACWLGILMCDRARVAGTVDMTIRELIEMDRSKEDANRGSRSRTMGAVNRQAFDEAQEDKRATARSLAEAYAVIRALTSCSADGTVMPVRSPQLTSDQWRVVLRAHAR